MIDPARLLEQIPIGKQNARKGDDIAKHFGLKDTRQIRLVIRDLIHDGWPICSTPHPPYGYFLANGPDEVKESLAVIRHYGLELFHHYHDLKNATRVIRDPYQMQMTGLVPNLKIKLEG